MKQIRYIASNEAIRGPRTVLRDKLLSVGWESVDLDVLIPGADLAFTVGEKLLGVQVKSPLDFFQSWVSGRLQRQLHSLISSVDIPVLLIEQFQSVYNQSTGAFTTPYGDVTESTGTVSYAAYAHALADCMSGAPARFALILSPSTNWTLDWLLEHCPKHYSKQLDSWNRIELPTRHRDAAIRALLSIDGISSERAVKLLRVFKTPIAAIMGLMVGDWEQISGIGPGIQMKAKRQFTTEWKELT